MNLRPYKGFDLEIRAALSVHGPNLGVQDLEEF